MKYLGLETYRRLLSIAYLIGAFLHLMDVFSLRLPFGSMDLIWKSWIIFLLLGDSIAAAGLWFGKPWGTAAFALVAGSQLVAYCGFREQFGDQWPLIVFHIVTLFLYLFLYLIFWARQRLRSANQK